MRLIDWPRDLHWISREPLTGPRAIGAGSTESLTGFTQSYASPMGLWRWSFSFPNMRGREFREWRGLVTALHGGANAVRVPFCDPDGYTFAQIGATVTQAQQRGGVPWSNGKPWSNGQNWRVGRPLVAVVQSADLGASEIVLAGTHWGHVLGMGSMLGFAPLHFGLYIVTQVIEPGRYRIWPPLRKTVSTSDFATLTPVMAMRLAGEAAANLPRGAAYASGLTATFIEVEDADIRTYFAD